MYAGFDCPRCPFSLNWPFFVGKWPTLLSIVVSRSYTCRHRQGGRFARFVRVARLHVTQLRMTRQGKRFRNAQPQHTLDRYR